MYSSIVIISVLKLMMATINSSDLDTKLDPTELTREEIENRLVHLFRLIDVDGESSLSLHEIEEYTYARLKDMDIRRGKILMKKYDKDGNGAISWREVIPYVFQFEYEDMKLELDKAAKYKHNQLAEHLKVIEQRFRQCDLNKDNYLTPEEFAPFISPSHYDHTAMSERTLLMGSFDQDLDDRVSYQEFMKNGDQSSEEKELFRSSDINKDGFLSKDELTEIFMPSLRSQAKKEAEHLMEASDTNADKKITFKEMVNSSVNWLNSTFGRLSVIPDFNPHLHDEL